MCLRSACGITALVLVQCQATPPSTASPEPPPSQPAPRAEPPPAASPPPPPAPVGQPLPPPPSQGIDQPAFSGFEVWLTQTSITVVRDGDGLGTVATLEELRTILPKHPGDGDIVVRADPEIEYKTIVETLDALRTLGYPNVSFAARRQP